MQPLPGSPYLPPSSSVDEKAPPAIRSKWVPLISALFALPFLGVSIIGFVNEWSDRSSSATSEMVFGAMLATSFFLSIFGVFFAGRLASKSMDLRWGSVLWKLFRHSFLYSLPYAFSVLYSKFDLAEISRGVGDAIFVNSFTFIVFSLLLTFPLLAYFLLVFAITRWRIQRIVQASQPLAPNHSMQRTPPLRGGSADFER
jgi:hypothetical protein